ncbi:hypothetical protein [Castellaniella sp.]|uniref:hypothetical protein n=1 Tax=Castellaniella sp. TaxID=1955812 RepID=UPI002AFDD5F6|nr:hypothetical protein [Castellaniella sp.]
MLVAVALVLAGCTFTGNGLNTAGLDRIVVGRTTLDQASADLGAQPTDTWQQGDTLLARWAYKGTVATDAVYARQEVWLRFGPDGTFQRMENSINVPALRHPRTAAEADHEAAQQQAKAQPKASAAGEVDVQTTADDGMIVIPGNGEPGAHPAAAGPIPVPPPPPVSSGSAAASTQGQQPLLPAGSTVVPGVTYPLSSSTKAP